MIEDIMPQPAYYIFKCQQSAPPGTIKPSCVKHDDPESAQLFQYLAQQLMMKGLISTVQAVHSGCLGRCRQPVMLVEPGHTMYVKLTKEKIDRIIQEHILGGNVVQEYVIADELWGEPIKPSEIVG